MATINQEIPFGKLDYVQRWVEAHEHYFEYFTHHARAMALVEAEENNFPQSSSMQNAINNAVLKKYFPVLKKAKDIGNIELPNKNFPQLSSELTVASYEKLLKKYSYQASKKASPIADVEAHESNSPSQAKVLSRVETDNIISQPSRQPAIITRVSTNT